MKNCSEFCANLSGQSTSVSIVCGHVHYSRVLCHTLNAFKKYCIIHTIFLMFSLEEKWYHLSGRCDGELSDVLAFSPNSPQVKPA